MRLIRSIAEMIRERSSLEGTVGFVPTMGYLHEGHLSLIRQAERDTDTVVTSIFVNPTQFAPGEDFDRYPRDLERDEALAEKAGTDIIFYPSREDMYPESHASYVVPEGLDRHLCGASRPGHFRGVMTVVLKLFQIVRPTDTYFGQKDIQQARILEQMVEDFHLPVNMHVEPIIREPDGVAMSSRNVYLSDEERRQAVCLHEGLTRVAEAVQSGEKRVEVLERILRETVNCRPLARLDYASIVDDRTLQPIQQITEPAIAALAVRFGNTRLIDNTRIGVDDAD